MTTDDAASEVLGLPLDAQAEATSRTSGESEQPAAIPVAVHELFVVLLMVLVCDITWYRSDGFAGPALSFLLLPWLISWGCSRRRFDVSQLVLLPLVILLSLRLVWCGSPLAFCAGLVLLCCFAVSLEGVRPYLNRVALFASRALVMAGWAWHRYMIPLERFVPALLKSRLLSLSVALPLVALAVFGGIFVMANPDLVASIDGYLKQLADLFDEWISHTQTMEILFCLMIGWIALGALQASQRRDAEIVDWLPVESTASASPMYEAFRNTLIALIGLFAVYLVFEFQTLWFRKFPDKFHYSGYAHEGAAWLTLALALSTFTLSGIFRGRIWDDPRCPRLKVWAWVWSAENLLLAVAVFNRLFIYIGFNGMTRMRVVGMLGVASVIGGFLLVLRKIARRYGFVWLIQRQLWTVSFAIYLYAVLPVDAFVNRYNVAQIMAGNPRPSVQISVHPTTNEGFLFLEPLLNCPDEKIRKGVLTQLRYKLGQLEDEWDTLERRNWTALQLARNRLLTQLRQSPMLRQDKRSTQECNADLGEFERYAYQWY